MVAQVRQPQSPLARADHVCVLMPQRQCWIVAASLLSLKFHGEHRDRFSPSDLVKQLSFLHIEPAYRKTHPLLALVSLRAFLFPNFLSDAECDFIVKLCKLRSFHLCLPSPQHGPRHALPASQDRPHPSVLPPRHLLVNQMPEMLAEASDRPMPDNLILWHRLPSLRPLEKPPFPGSPVVCTEPSDCKKQQLRIAVS